MKLITPENLQISGYSGSAIGFWRPVSIETYYVIVGKVYDTSSVDCVLNSIRRNWKLVATGQSVT